MQNLSQPFPKPVHASNDKEARRKPSIKGKQQAIRKRDVCINGCLHNWLSINVTGISGTMITMPDMAYVSIFTDNNLTHITEDHFEIKLIVRLLDQMYVIQPSMFPLRYDDTLPSAPQFPEHLHSLLTHS